MMCDLQCLYHSLATGNVESRGLPANRVRILDTPVLHNTVAWPHQRGKQTASDGRINRSLDGAEKTLYRCP